MQLEYFNGYKIPQQDKERGYISYDTLSHNFHMILCNDITKLCYSELDGEMIEPEIVNGDIDKDNEIFQYYLIDANDFGILESWTNELVLYITQLDLYVWCVGIWGTSWEQVSTEIEIEE